MRRLQSRRLPNLLYAMLLFGILMLPLAACGGTNNGGSGQPTSAVPTPSPSPTPKSGAVYTTHAGVNCSDFHGAAKLSHPENEQHCFPGVQGKLELKEGHPEQGESFFPEYDLTAPQTVGLETYEFSVHADLTQSKENGAGVIVETPQSSAAGGYMSVVYPSGSWKLFDVSKLNADNIETVAPLAYGSVAPGRTFDIVVIRKDPEQLTLNINGSVGIAAIAPFRKQGVFGVLCATPMLGISNDRLGPVYFTNLQVTR